MNVSRRGFLFGAGAATAALAAQAAKANIPLLGAGASGGAAAAAVVEVEFMGASPLIDPDPGNRGIVGNGFVVRMRVTTLAATTFDPTLVTFNASDPGYTISSGAVAVTTRTRALPGYGLLRQQALNAGAIAVYTVVTGLFTDYYITTIDPIWQGTTITSIVCAPGFYGAATSGVVNPAVITKNTTLAYEKPVAGWLNAQRNLATGSSYHVEMWAMHESAMFGQGVVGVEFIGSDGSHTATTQTATGPTLSTNQTQGPIAECYAADIPLTALDNQGASATPGCSVNAIIYPHIGDSSAVLNLSTDGVAGPTVSPQTLLTFVNDKNGTYGGLYAYVDGIGAAPATSTNPVTARATPYATITAALAGLATGNAARATSHSDHGGGIVRLRDTQASYTLTATQSTAAGAAWVIIEEDPLNVTHPFYDLATTRTITNGNWKMRCKITRSAAAQFGNTAGTGKYFCIDGATVDLTTGSSSFIQNFDFVYQSNTTFLPAAGTTGVSSAALGTNGSTVQGCALSLGINWQSTTIAASFVPYVMVGCFGGKFTLNDKGSGQTSIDGGIVANNTFGYWTGTAAILVSGDISKGFALVQNVFEVTDTSGIDFNFTGGSHTNNTKNCLVAYNCWPGSDDPNLDDGRINHDYNDTAPTTGKTSWSLWKYNWSNRMATKTDYFARNNTGITGGGFTGDFFVAYGVRNRGNGLGFNRPIDPTGQEYFRRFADARTKVNLGTMYVVNNQSGKTGGGGGNYRPQPSGAHGGANSPMYGMVAPAGQNNQAVLGLLKYDLDGNLRHDNANGPYELAA